LDAAAGGGAAWSPTTDQLLFYDQTGATVIEDADGSNRREAVVPHTNTAAGESFSCAYRSPDGKWLACVEERWSVSPGAGTQTPGPSQTPSAMTPPDQNRTYVGLIRVAADTGDPHEVYSLGPNPGERIWPIGWSADSTKILFSVREAQATSREGLFRLRLYLVAAEGGPALDLGLTSSIFAPLARSPDGQRFAITAGRLIESWTDKSIAVVDLQSGRVTPLTGPAMAAVSPAWSPDGSSIGFVASADHGVPPPDAPVDVRRAAEDAGLASRRLWVMAADGSGQRQLTSDAELRDEAPEWSSDGAHILFARLPIEPCARQYSLWLMDVRDGTLDEVAAGLPLFGTYEALQVGDIPRCPDFNGGSTDWYGFLSLNQVLDWWQEPIAPP
jgi:dipeptidyl aminopeptidase/acylaminoacyl peptidase